ncbi:hypothetical protein CDV55_108496 [Aspergillus turcosus]|nr:hypothetical protein CDV55_108496 [Aspergillus turcosus]
MFNDRNGYDEWDGPDRDETIQQWKVYLAGIWDLAGKSLKHLFSLQRKLKDSGFHLQIISSQIVAVNAAITHIQSWLDTYTADTCLANGVAEDLKLSLNGCSSLLAIFSEQVADLDSGHDALSWTDRVKFVWNETELKNYRDMLRDQVQALSLLLQVVKLPTTSEQMSLLTVVDNQKIIQRARDDSTSLIQLRDTDTLYSINSLRDNNNDDLERLSMSFDFDSEVFQSRAYQAVLGPYVRTKLLEERAASKNKTENPASVTLDNTIPALVQLYHNKGSRDVDQSMPSVTSIARHLGVEQTKLENLLFQARNGRKRQLERHKSALRPLKPGRFTNLMSDAKIRAGLLELNQIYRSPYGLGAISINDFNSFQHAWKIYDPNGIGYICQEDLPRFLSVSQPHLLERDVTLLIEQKLDNPFSIRVYDPKFSISKLLSEVGTTIRVHDPELSIHGLLSEVGTAAAPSPALKSFIQILEDKLENLPVNEIKMRRAALNIFYREIALMAEPDKGVSFWAVLSSLLNFRKSSDPDWRSSSIKDVLIALEQDSPVMLGNALQRHYRLLRVEEKKKIETVIGFFHTLYWSRELQRQKEHRSKACIATPSPAPAVDAMDYW